MDDINAKLNREDPFRDVLGQPLEAGDFVIYSASSSGRLAVAQIISFTRKKIRIGHVGSTYSWLAGPDRIVKVEVQNA